VVVVKKTRLFHTLVLCGASLTGGAVAVATTASAVLIAGCGDDTTTGPPADMAHYFDIGVPRDDLSRPLDLTSHD
jgi:hypothetical protein